MGDAEALTAGLPLIVVMPDTGPLGGYVDWWHGASPGRRSTSPGWSRGWTAPTARSRAAAAALWPGCRWAGSARSATPRATRTCSPPRPRFSGAVDSIEPAIQAVTPPGTYGPFATQEIRWRGKQPAGPGRRTSAACGSPCAPATASPAGRSAAGRRGRVRGAQGERGAPRAARARSGIPHVWDDYGPGGHLWPYWRGTSGRTLPWLMNGFAHPPRPPAPFTYRTIEPRYGVYGWRVRIKRPGARVEQAEQRGPPRVQRHRQRHGPGGHRPLFRPRTPVAVTARFSFGRPRRTVVQAPTRRGGSRSRSRSARATGRRSTRRARARSASGRA